MKLIGLVKTKLFYIVLGRVFRDVAEGKHGHRLQAAYLWSKGKKTITGMLLFLIFGAVTTFDPPFAKSFFAAATAASGALMALGLLDAGWNNRPAFPIWFLESLKRVTGAVAAFHAALVPLTELVHLLYPDGDVFLHNVELYATAVTIACGYVNRYAAASLAPPPQIVPATSITGEFSLKETMKALENTPLVAERRAPKRGPTEADGAAKKGDASGSGT